MEKDDWWREPVNQTAPGGEPKEPPVNKSWCKRVVPRSPGGKLRQKKCHDSPLYCEKHSTGLTFFQVRQLDAQVRGVS